MLASSLAWLCIGRVMPSCHFPHHPPFQPSIMPAGLPTSWVEVTFCWASISGLPPGRPASLPSSFWVLFFFNSCSHIFFCTGFLRSPGIELLLPSSASYFLVLFCQPSVICSAVFSGSSALSLTISCTCSKGTCRQVQSHVVSPSVSPVVCCFPVCQLPLCSTSMSLSCIQSVSYFPFRWFYLVSVPVWSLSVLLCLCCWL